MASSLSKKSSYLQNELNIWRFGNVLLEIEIFLEIFWLLHVWYVKCLHMRGVQFLNTGHSFIWNKTSPFDLVELPDMIWSWNLHWRFPRDTQSWLETTSAWPIWLYLKNGFWSIKLHSITLWLKWWCHLSFPFCHGLKLHKGSSFNFIPHRHSP